MKKTIVPYKGKHTKILRAEIAHLAELGFTITKWVAKPGSGWPGGLYNFSLRGYGRTLSGFFGSGRDFCRIGIHSQGLTAEPHRSKYIYLKDIGYPGSTYRAPMVTTDVLIDYCMGLVKK